MNYNDIFSIESMDKPKEEKYYVFMRLYKAEYKNPINACHIIDEVLVAANDAATDDQFYNHVALNYKLTDDYLGLTLYGENDFKYEKCTKPNENRYMAGCDDKKSIYGVYSIEVKKSEYKRIVSFLNNKEETKKFKYSVVSLIKLLGGLLQYNSKDGAMKLAQSDNNTRTSSIFNDNNGFCCSTMVAYILEQCAPSVSKKIKLKIADFSKISPSALTRTIPNCVPLFSGKWVNYNKDLVKFLNKNVEFKQFLEVN